jgi:hypothetical protein
MFPTAEALISGAYRRKAYEMALTGSLEPSCLRVAKSVSGERFARLLARYQAAAKKTTLADVKRCAGTGGYACTAWSKALLGKNKDDEVRTLLEGMLKGSYGDDAMDAAACLLDMLHSPTARAATF